MTIPVVIPAKPLDRALSRLGGVLAPSARLAVQIAMLTDVIRAGVGFSDEVIVVSGDQQVAQIAADCGARVVADQVPAAGINVAVARGVCALADEEVMVVMGDLPLATSTDLQALVAALGRRQGIACAVSADGTGTNAMYLRPPGVIDTAFGTNSLMRHLALAEQAGVAGIAAVVRGLQRDIDTPDDLAALVRSGHDCATARVCDALGVFESFSATVARQ